ncbi:hypothetical protein L6452_03464 [Arctium lappa]|uniref:Uncharacterized protein n=1 Tax=Arctium lappa TaxID=4217 RepID=A0ACB9FMF6_ARCLA|nr:hypothetical protein L6452_03464 [Arctium lappa]
MEMALGDSRLDQILRKDPIELLGIYPGDIIIQISVHLLEYLSISGDWAENVKALSADLMRVTPRDANYTGQNSKFYILRPELITAFCQVCKEKLKQPRNWEDVNHVKE